MFTPTSTYKMHGGTQFSKVYCKLFENSAFSDTGILFKDNLL